MGRGLDPFGVDGRKRVKVVEDAGKLRREALDIVRRQRDASEAGNVEDFFSSERHGEKGTRSNP